MERRSEDCSRVKLRDFLERLRLVKISRSLALDRIPLSPNRQDKTVAKDIVQLRYILITARGIEQVGISDLLDKHGQVVLSTFLLCDLVLGSGLDRLVPSVDVRVRARVDRSCLETLSNERHHDCETNRETSSLWKERRKGGKEGGSLSAPDNRDPTKYSFPVNHFST